jgi:exodeoxyribonuclease VII small subunit
LVDVVRRLESGGETLEESLALWQRGEALAAHCERWLAGARAQIEAAQSASAPKSSAQSASAQSSPDRSGD